MEPKRIHAAIGDAIRTRRKHLRLTQEQLASRLGLSRASLANIETGRQAILVHHLYKIAEVLEITPLDLMPRPEISGKSVHSVEQLSLPDDLNVVQRRQIQSLLE